MSTAKKPTRRGPRGQRKIDHGANPNTESIVKRKRPEDVEEDNVSQDAKRQRRFDAGEQEGHEDAEPYGGDDRPFYGLLQDEEQEYFRRADELLEANDFPSDEERSLFLSNVFQELGGKELKVACSQSCSRLMERLILLSTVEQKRTLFGKFMGNWKHLVQHRFASHCCEALFLRTGEVVMDDVRPKTRQKPNTDGDDEPATLEDLILATLDELENDLGEMLTSKHASHCFRALLVVLAGRSLEQDKSLLRSKKKENNTIAGLASREDDEPATLRPVPARFEIAISTIKADIIANLHPDEIRALTMHKTGSPTIQLLLEIELTTAKSKSDDQKAKEFADGDDDSSKTLLSILMPDDLSPEESKSRSLMVGLLHDPVGSHTLELLLRHLPAKSFRAIYRTVLLPRIAGLALSDVACYPLMKALARLSREDLEAAIAQIIPRIPELLENNRTVILRTIIERCGIRGAETKQLVEAILDAHGGTPSTFIQRLLQIDPSSITLPDPSKESTNETETEIETHPDSTRARPDSVPKATAQQTHASLLAQAMLTVPGPPADLIQASIVALTPADLARLAIHPPTSRLLQCALAPSLRTPAQAHTSFLRRVLSALFAPLPASTTPSTSTSTSQQRNALYYLAPHPTGSYLLTTLFDLTTSPQHTSLFVFCERIMQALADLDRQALLQHTFAGRRVWKVWKGGVWKWGKGRWVSDVKAAGLAAASAAASVTAKDAAAQTSKAAAEPAPRSRPGKRDASRRTGQDGSTRVADTPQTAKTGIELAREKWALQKAKANATGENATPARQRKRLDAPTA